jgi:hypothetical protein
MTDDVCGAETTGDGSPCQHPAGSCPVPSHSNPDAENPHGRDFAIGEDDREDILEAARMGKSERGCARAAGVSSWAQLNRYLDAHPDFRSAFERARATGETHYIREGADPSGDVDPSFAKFMLSSSYGYAEKQEREHSGEMNVNHEADFSDTST